MESKMELFNLSDSRENWRELLLIWNKVVNWHHYNTPKSILRNEIKHLLIYLWNEKDWLKKEYPTKKNYIEKFINCSQYIRVVGDLANSIKHRGLSRKSRSGVQQINYKGQMTFSTGATREMFYLKLGDETIVDVLHVLKGAIEEYEELHKDLNKVYNISMF